jgi:hypothetical protein
MLAKEPLNMVAAPVDARYYQAAQPRSVGERLMIVARDRIYADFLRLCRPGPDSRILDVGISDVLTDSANMLERKFPHPEQITAVGLGEAPEFQAAFPSVAYRRIEANRPLPFADGAFDIATSNAVIEHVGSVDNQRAFVAELTRVARVVFISAPNRFFPVEHHTAIPLAHFWPAGFRLACRALGKQEWLDPANLILTDRRALARFAPNGTTGFTGLALGPFSSNIFLFVDSGCGG